MTEICPDCGKDMKRRRGKTGEFWGCTGYPDCKKTLNISNQVAIPANAPATSGDGRDQIIANEVVFKGIMDNWDWFSKKTEDQIDLFYNTWAYRLMQPPKPPEPERSTTFPETMEDEEPPDYEE